MADREYDVVLWGATGFTGRLVAEHLASTYGPAHLDWAIAGRSRERLERLRDELAALDPDWSSLDVLVGEAHDRERLEAIAARTKVVCAAVGPFSRHGSPLVEACLATGTDYCDLAGEVLWLRRMVDEHHEAAREAGVRLVHACGFDAVPSDLGTLLVQRHAAEATGAACSTVKTAASAGSFGLSGGTIAAILETFEAADGDPAGRRVLGDPRSLTGGDGSPGPTDGSPRGPAYDDDVEQWTAPFLMAPINEKVVHRSHALLGESGGPRFSYHERASTGTGLTGAARATALAAGLALTTATLSVASLRRLVDRFVLPDAGTGPSRATIEGRSFEFRLHGRGPASGSGDEFVVTGRVASDRGPYGATGWMAGEAAMCLTRGETESPLDGGVLTPASGIGTPLVDRLRDVGMTFDVGVGSSADN